MRRGDLRAPTSDVLPDGSARFLPTRRSACCSPLLVFALSSSLLVCFPAFLSLPSLLPILRLFSTVCTLQNISFYRLPSTFFVSSSSSSHPFSRRLPCASLWFSIVLSDFSSDISPSCKKPFPFSHVSFFFVVFFAFPSAPFLLRTAVHVFSLWQPLASAFLLSCIEVASCRLCYLLVSPSIFWSFFSRPVSSLFRS